VAPVTGSTAPAPAAPIVAEPRAAAPAENAVGELASRETERDAARAADGVIAQEAAPPGYVADAPAARAERRAIVADDSLRRESEEVDALTTPATDTATAPPAAQALRKAQAPQAANEAQDDAEKLETIEVTGSRIRRTDLETSQPVFVVGDESPEKSTADRPDADRAPRRDVGASESRPTLEAKQDQRLRQAPAAPPAEPEPVIAEELLAAPPPPPPPPAPAAPPAPKAATATATESAPAYDYTPEASSNEVDRAASPAGREQAKPSAGLGLRGATLTVDRASETTWFEGIRALIARGQLREAREELKALRERHPRAEVPRDIEDALR
jgi:hypothetical protein